MSEYYFKLIVWIWIGLAIILFPILLRITVPYGRHTKTTWGKMINNRTGWIIMESFSLIAFSVFFLLGKNYQNLITWIFFGFWALHYINRSIIYPARLKTRGKRMPLLIMFLAIFFNMMNGYINGHYLGSFANVYSLEWLFDIRFIVGGILFVAGLIINWHSDAILINLRNSTHIGYKIPYGGLFHYVSCPNHLGEIIEWTGFAILTWSLPAFAFAIWTIVNILPRSLDHHKWYKNEFKEYPENRKAIVPFIL